MRRITVVLIATAMFGLMLFNNNDMSNAQEPIDWALPYTPGEYQIAGGNVPVTFSSGPHQSLNMKSPMEYMKELEA